MTRHRIAQIARNRNPKSPETSPKLFVSGKIHYFTLALSPSCSMAWRFFTGDHILSVLRKSLQPAAVNATDGAAINQDIEKRAADCAAGSAIPVCPRRLRGAIQE